MALLNKKYLQFDKDDVKLMQTMLRRFHEMHQNTGMPDYSNTFVGYLPVFAISLLAAQESVDKLTRKLVWLTRMLALFTIVLVGLTLVLLFKG